MTRIITATSTNACGSTDLTSCGETDAATKHEQHADQQLDERLLELVEREADVEPPLIGESDPQQHRREKARILSDQIGGHHGGHNDHQGRRHDHTRRASVHLMEQEPESRRGKGCDQRTDAVVRRMRSEADGRAGVRRRLDRVLG
jgi:hypothetical protein